MRVRERERERVCGLGVELSEVHSGFGTHTRDDFVVRLDLDGNWRRERYLGNK